MSQSPQDSSSRSQSRGRLSTTLAALSAKIANTLNSPSEHGNATTTSPSPNRGPDFGLTRSKGREEDEITIATSEGGDRSLSRGRNAFSTGRGGVGNIRCASASRDARPDTGPDDFSPARGREPQPRLAESSPNHVISTGRGGAGNIRSPSRDAHSSATAEAAEKLVIRAHLAEGAAHSTGRGGIGNITGGSRSRSRARDSSIPPGSGTHTPLHSSGRGGAGNIFSGHTPSVAEADEKDAASQIHPGPRHSSDIHSTGRGGVANIVHAHAPPVEHTHHKHHPDGYESTGRGGAGNIVHT